MDFSLKQLFWQYACCCLFCCCPLQARADPDLVFRQYETAKTNFTLDSVFVLKSPDWQVCSSPAFGRKGIAGWVKFEVNAWSGQVGWLEIQSHFIDTVEVWVVCRNRVTQHFKTGSLMLPDTAEADPLLKSVSHHYFIFSLHLPDTATVYVRGFVLPPDVLKFPIRLWQPSEFMQYYRQDTASWAAFCGIMLTVTLIALVSYLVRSGSIYLSYAGYVTAMTGYALLNDGWGVLLPPGWRFLDDNISLLYWLNGGLLCFILFSRRFLTVSPANLWLRLAPFGLAALVLFTTLFIQWMPASSVLREVAYRAIFVLVPSYFFFWMVYVYDAFCRKYSVVWLHLASVSIVFTFYLTNTLANEQLIHLPFPDMVAFRWALAAEAVAIMAAWVYRQKIQQDSRIKLEKENEAQQQAIFEALRYRQTQEIKALKLQNELQSQRERLARDLHDGIGSQLTHIINRLDVMSENNREKQALVRLSDFTRETNRLLRETIWVLNQEHITLHIFGERLRGWLSRLWHDLELPALKLNLAERQDILLSPLVASALFRIGQEAVSNALKYAAATELKISLQTEAGWLCFQVQDNGIGFNPDTVSRGYGLSNIEKRTAELEGTFSLNTSPTGTEICIRIPLLRQGMHDISLKNT